MKILLISAEINKHGGISRCVAELAERFVKKHETHLLTTNYDYEVRKLIVHKKPMIRKPFWLQVLSNAYYNTKYAKKIKDEILIDIVSSNGAESLFCDIVTMHSCHKAAIKAMNKVSKEELSYPKYLFYKTVRWVIPTNRVVLAIEKCVLEKGSKKIIAVSEGVKREILENYDVPEDKIIVIPNGVDIDEFKPDEERKKSVRERYGIKEDEFVLMFSGYEFKRKGLKYIIEALPKVKGNVKLLVVGEDNPELYKELALKLGFLDNIIFAGFVPDISEYYAASDIFVFPTRYEPFGLVITEAMASGVAVITSRNAGAAELMSDGHDGVLLNDSTNQDEIAERINLLAEDEKLREQIGINARKTAEKYSWDEVAKRTMDVYKEMVE